MDGMLIATAIDRHLFFAASFEFLVDNTQQEHILERRAIPGQNRLVYLQERSWSLIHFGWKNYDDTP